MPRGCDEDDEAIKDGAAHCHPSARTTRPDSMFLPEQTPSSPSPSPASPSHSSLSSRTPIQTPPPAFPYAFVPLQQSPVDRQPLLDYDMYLYEGDELDDIDRTARRRRAHGKRRQRDDALALTTRAGNASFSLNASSSSLINFTYFAVTPYCPHPFQVAWV